MKRVLAALFIVLAVSLMCVFTNVQQAQAAFPDKPITFIVPFRAGGGTDGTARALAPRLEKLLGVPVVVKNEGGSGGRRGSISLYKSKNDGYTIGFAHFATLIYDETLGKKKNPIDYTKFAAILKVDQAQFFVNVNKKSAFKSIMDFKAANRAIKFGATGVGSPSYLIPKALQMTLGFDASFVTGQKNLGAAALSVARGDIDSAVGTYTHIRGVIEDIRSLVYISDERSQLLPDVPTIKELGYGEFADFNVPWIVVAPPGSPEDRLEVIRAALRKIMKDKEFLDWAVNAGYSPILQEPDACWKSLQALKALYEGLK